MKRIFLLIAFIPSLAIGAITELYVTTTGAGTHDGSSEGNAFSWAEMIASINGGSAAGNRYNIKNDGTYSRTTTTDNLTGVGTVSAPIILRGYSSTIGDGFQGRSNGNGALVTTNMPVVTYTTGRLNCSSGTFILIESLNIDSAASSATIGLNADCFVKSCVVSNSSTNASATGVGAVGLRNIVFDSDVSLTGASGGSTAIAAGAVSVKILNNRVSVVSTSAPGISVSGTNNTASIVGNVIHSTGGVGIAMAVTTGTPLIYGNTIYSADGDGIDIVTGSSYLTPIVNNMITDGSAYGIDMVSTSNAAFLAYNRTRDNTSGAIGNSGDWITATTYGHVTTDGGDASTDYANAGAGDFEVISTSPAAGTGWFTNNDIGAIQAVAGSGGASNVSFASGE